jgi:anti-sigma factor RsiW
MVGQGFDARRDYCPGGVQRDAAGWVLGALDAVEARNFAAHLLTCRACQLAVAELQPAARALLARPSLQPPEHLTVATLARVRQAASRSQRSAR